MEVVGSMMAADTALTPIAPVAKKPLDMVGTRTAPVASRLRDTAARNAQGMVETRTALVVSKLADTVLTLTAPVARNLLDMVETLTLPEADMVPVRKPQATVLKRARATGVRRPLATAAAATSTEVAATTKTSTARGDSSTVEEAAMVVGAMRGMVAGTKPPLYDLKSVHWAPCWLSTGSWAELAH
jgi:hypothetical protein